MSGRCDTSSCEAPQVETHRLKSPAPPPAKHQFSQSFQNPEKIVTLLTVAPVALFLCTCENKIQGKYVTAVVVATLNHLAEKLHHLSCVNSLVVYLPSLLYERCTIFFALFPQRRRGSLVSRPIRKRCHLMATRIKVHQGQ